MVSKTLILVATIKADMRVKSKMAVEIKTKNQVEKLTLCIVWQKKQGSAAEVSSK